MFIVYDEYIRITVSDRSSLVLLFGQESQYVNLYELWVLHKVAAALTSLHTPQVIVHGRNPAHYVFDNACFSSTTFSTLQRAVICTSRTIEGCNSSCQKLCVCVRARECVCVCVCVFLVVFVMLMIMSITMAMLMSMHTLLLTSWWYYSRLGLCYNTSHTA